MPEILSGNREIFNLLQLAGGQWRTDINGPSGMDFGVLMTMAKDLGMTRDDVFYSKLRAYEQTVLAAVKDKKETDNG